MTCLPRNPMTLQQSQPTFLITTQIWRAAQTLCIQSCMRVTTRFSYWESRSINLQINLVSMAATCVILIGGLSAATRKLVTISWRHHVRIRCQLQVISALCISTNFELLLSSYTSRTCSPSQNFTSLTSSRRHPCLLLIRTVSENISIRQWRERPPKNRAR